jgi:hypothetical protein
MDFTSVRFSIPQGLACDAFRFQATVPRFPAAPLPRLPQVSRVTHTVVSDFKPSRSPDDVSSALPFAMVVAFRISLFTFRLSSHIQQQLQSLKGFGLLSSQTEF